MATIGSIIMIAGGLAMLVGGIWMLLEQFRTSIIWGIGCIIIPFVSLIWLVMHFDRGKYPFLIQIAGLIVLVLGAFLGNGFE